MQRNSSDHPVLRQGRKKHGRARKIILAIVGVIAAALIVLLAVNYKTIALAFGKGSVHVNNLDQVKTSILKSGEFDNLSESTDAQGDRMLTGVTKDGAISFSLKQYPDGRETVTAQIDLKKLDLSGIDKQALLKGNTEALKKAKSVSDKIFRPVVGNEATGLESYLAQEALKESRNSPDDIQISHRFGATSVDLTGSLTTKKATLILNQ